jgi:hypothetical protein
MIADHQFEEGIAHQHGHANHDEPEKYITDHQRLSLLVSIQKRRLPCKRGGLYHSISRKLTRGVCKGAMHTKPPPPKAPSPQGINTFYSEPFPNFYFALQQSRFSLRPEPSPSPTRFENQ